MRAKRLLPFCASPGLSAVFVFAPTAVNKIFSFYIIVFNGLALGGAAGIMKTLP